MVQRVEISLHMAKGASLATVRWILWAASCVPIFHGCCDQLPPSVASAAATTRLGSIEVLATADAPDSTTKQLSFPQKQSCNENHRALLTF